MPHIWWELNKCLRMNIKNLLYEGLEMTLHLILENLVFEKGKQEWDIWKRGFTMDLW